MTWGGGASGCSVAGRTPGAGVIGWPTGAEAAAGAGVATGSVALGSGVWASAEDAIREANPKTEANEER